MNGSTTSLFTDRNEVVWEVLEHDLPTLTQDVDTMLERGEAGQNQTGEL
jgi:hypothetical protein